MQTKAEYAKHSDTKFLTRLQRIDVALEESAAKIFPKGTIVYTIFATLGEVAILDFEAASNQAIAGIVPNNDMIDTGYLYYCLKAEKSKRHF